MIEPGSTQGTPSWSIRELIEVRAAYHVHVAHLQNVVATAIGLFRIRREDEDAREPPRAVVEAPIKMESPPRTLSNSMVVPWSQPCLLVFVDRWLTREEMSRDDADQVVPRWLYMPDGKRLRTCVILAPRDLSMPTPTPARFPGQLLGGGYPILADVQGTQHLAALGCLVTDGDRTFGLTNRHVTGTGDQRQLYTLRRGERVPVGRASGLTVGKHPFGDVYPGWPDARTLVDVDTGLVELDDLGCWTAQVLGIGPVGDPLDLNVDTISLDLIGLPVRATGPVSGTVLGEVQALFYRYRAIGGFDYVTDLLIGPRGPQGSVVTRPGDSGTVWFLDETPDTASAAHRAARQRDQGARPLAVQWGGQSFLGAEGERSGTFALASFLSTTLRLLDLNVVRGWNIDHREYWGKSGHYKVARTALGLVGDKKLTKLLSLNADRISFDDAEISTGDLPVLDPNAFVPLADVADIVWRTTRPKDSSNHFGDIDEMGADAFAGRTLAELYEADPSSLSLDTWNAFYASIGATKRGALPFRVWQMYQEMVEHVAARRIDSFVAVAGLMAHYVGDACQPLHSSKLHHGRTEAEKDVHSRYETDMLDRFAADIVEKVNLAVKGSVATADLRGGVEAAKSIMQLMLESIAALPPLDVITAFVEAEGHARLPHMFDVLGDRTAERLGAGSLALARLWASAWAEGSGPSVPSSAIVAVSEGDLRSMYEDPTFSRSYVLTDPALAALLHI